MTTELYAEIVAQNHNAKDHGSSPVTTLPDAIMVPRNVLAYVIDHLVWSGRRAGLDSSMILATLLRRIHDAQTGGKND